MAAEKKKRASGSVARLVPDAITLVIDDREVIVASNAIENDNLNMIAVGVVRALFNEQMKQYKDKELLTPRELKDAVDAAAALIKMSKEAYGASEPLTEKSEKPAEEQKTVLDNITFDVAKPAENGDTGVKENP